MQLQVSRHKALRPIYLRLLPLRCAANRDAGSRVVSRTPGRPIGLERPVLLCGHTVIAELFVRSSLRLFQSCCAHSLQNRNGQRDSLACVVVEPRFARTLSVWRHWRGTRVQLSTPGALMYITLRGGKRWRVKIPMKPNPGTS